jgi:hypothetical protein
MTTMTIQSQVGTGILSLGACRLYDEPTGIYNLGGLRRERNSPRATERLRQAPEHRQIRVKRHAIEATGSQGRERLDLNSGRGLVWRAERRRLGRTDARMNAYWLLAPCAFRAPVRPKSRPIWAVEAVAVAIAGTGASASDRRFETADPSPHRPSYERRNAARRSLHRLARQVTAHPDGPGKSAHPGASIDRAA